MGIKDLIRYEPETGDFYRLTPTQGWEMPKKAGWVSRNGYRHITIRGVEYRSHRLAWFLMTGEWPDQIDHINGNRLDNRWENLRDVSRRENQRNVQRRRDNTSGITGISFVDREGRRPKWRAYISSDAGRIELGAFDSLLDAAAARKSAERGIGYHANHGRAANG